MQIICTSGFPERGYGFRRWRPRKQPMAGTAGLKFRRNSGQQKQDFALSLLLDAWRVACFCIVGADVGGSALYMHINP